MGLPFDGEAFSYSFCSEHHLKGGIIIAFEKKRNLGTKK